MSSALNVGGHVQIVGSADLKNTLDVSNATHLKGTLETDGLTRLHDRLIVGAQNAQKSTNLHGTLSVDDTITASSGIDMAHQDVNNAKSISTEHLSASSTVSANTLSATGTTTLHDSLLAKGASTLVSSLVQSGGSVVLGKASLGDAEIKINVPAATARMVRLQSKCP